MISYLDARHHGGRWLVRIEDIDPPREVEGAAEAIIDALARHGLYHDATLRFQSTSRELHEAAIERLLSDGHAYFCRCSRRQLRETGHADRYPGTCRNLGLTRGAVRVRIPKSDIVIYDRWQGRASFNLHDSPGDFIIRRKDGLVAYQLAVVVDDGDQRITDVVRGVDLFDSTPRQTWLQTLLGLPRPRYAHFPVVVDRDGHKLSKQTGAPELDPDKPGENLTRALGAMGMPPPAGISGRGPEALLAWAGQVYDPTAFAGMREFPAVAHAARGTAPE